MLQEPYSLLDRASWKPGFSPVSSGIVVERVPSGPHGPNQLGLAVEVDRLAHPANMHVDGPDLNVAIAAPDRVEQSLAREDSPGMFEEMAQQPEFGRPERDGPPGALHLVADYVHFEVGEAELLAGQSRPHPAQHRLHPRHQLAWAERLGDIIVGAGFQASHPIRFLAAAG